MRPCFPARAFARASRELRLGRLLLAACVLASVPIDAQVLTGALVGTVKDEHGAVLPGALVRVTSPALIGGPATMTTNERGQLRFPILPPGTYALDIERPELKNVQAWYARLKTRPAYVKYVMPPLT